MAKRRQLLDPLAAFFRIFGDPALFFLKIILYTINLLIINLFHLLEGTIETLVWFIKLIKIPRPRFLILDTKPLVFLLGFLACFIFIFVPYEIAGFLKQLPNPKSIQNGNYPVTTKIYDRNYTLLYEIYTDQNRTPVKLADLPKYVPQAHVAIEDKNFYRHFGFDPVAVLRAALANWQGWPIQGGSTITQQLVKFSLLTPERTIERKTKEIILSFWAEWLYSKDGILEMYLNQIPYGGSAYGIEAAAKTYFGKSAKSLTLAEAALLAGLPSAPTVYSPLGSHPELARDRQVAVLNAMVDQGYISEDEAHKAKTETLKYNSPQVTIKAPHFVMYVKDLLVQKYGIRTVEQGGLEVVTTLDDNFQNQAQTLVTNGVEKQNYLNVGNGAALITKPATGEILAMVGSIDYFNKEKDGNVNVALAPRSPGSSIKVVNYAAAIEKALVSASTIIDDEPINFVVPGQPVYSPKNYDGKFHGQVTVRTALGSSYNIPAVKTLAKLGVKNMIEKGQQMGITSWTDESRYGLSLTLGGGEVTMLDLATVFGTLANYGKKGDLNPIISVRDFTGQNLVTSHQSLATRVLSPQASFIISDILSDNAARTPAFGPASPLIIPNYTVAVKTGTAETKRDNWTIGYTPNLVVAVWVGNNNNAPMSPYLESGNTGAAAIWHDLMVNLLKDRPDQKFVRPENIVPVAICTLNGLLPCDNCPQVKTEYFLSGTEPKDHCQIEKKEEKKD